MLTERQEKYIATLPENKRVSIQPWDPRTEKVAEELMKQIQGVTGLKVLWLGASVLKLPGQNDIDLHILSASSRFGDYLPSLKEILGEPKSAKETLIEWRFVRDGIEVDCYLTDPDSPSFKEQVQLFELLRDDPELSEEYRQLKEDSNNLPVREYYKRKYEFYNRVLGLEK